MPDLIVIKRREITVIEAVSIKGQRWIEDNMELGIFNGIITVQTNVLEDLLKIFSENDLEVEER